MRTAIPRITARLDPALHNALSRKAGTTRRTISGPVADAVRESLREDEENFALTAARAAESTLTDEALIAKLKATGTR